VTLKFEVPRKCCTNRGSYREKPLAYIEQNPADRKSNISVCNRHSRGSYRAVLYSPRKYSTNHGSYALCGVFRICMYCIVGLSLAVRIVSYRSVSYRTEEIQYELRIVCIVRGLPHMYVLYCRPITRGSYRIVSYRIVSYRTEEIQYEPRIVCTVWGLSYM
jgi:hypothetical protein